MEINTLIQRQPFEGCVASYEEADIVLLGAGYDGTSSYRPGSRFAPLAIRSEALYSQENFSPYFEKDLSEKAIHDAGDIDLPIGDKKKAMDLIYDTAGFFFKEKKKPCVIGGEHLISLPIVQAAVESYPNLRIIHIDAHLDLMDELFGDRLSHGTVMRRILELRKDSRWIYQGGIRSGSKEEYDFAAEHTRLFPFSLKELAEVIPELSKHPVYLSLDLDVFDPALLPATGTPEAGGISFPEYINFLKTLRQIQIVGCDMVELSPKIDSTGNSTIHAAKILRELLMIL
jgi:agmatinase